jgi:Na+/H+ antiporter NhaD/arsenite permease-like protein
LVSATGYAVTSIYIGRLPEYSSSEWQVLLILFSLFVAVRGLQDSGLMNAAARHMQEGNAIALKLVLGCFLLSMLVTNDVALIVMVPLTLALDVQRKDLLVILEALAANAGSALTPFGNPQNLFIYWFYHLEGLEFIASIAPFSLLFLVLLAAMALAMRTACITTGLPAPRVSGSSWIYALILLIVLLVTLRLLPVWAAAIAPACSLLFQRRALHVDYALLFSFFFFFGLAENMKTLLAAELAHSGHVFLFSALASQVMSNVPATLLFAKFTDNWEALLWGSNAGGFGSLFGSLANLIAYRLYVNHPDTADSGRFTLKFLLLGYAAFFLSMGLYFLLHQAT